MTARERIQDRIATAMRLGGAYHAEAAGLFHALYSTVADPHIYSSPKMCERYLLGFRDGRAILEVEARSLSGSIEGVQP